MFREKFDSLSVNNEEEYLRHFGFTVEDISFLISPQTSLSPIKKKQRNVFNFDGFEENIDEPAKPNRAFSDDQYPENEHGEDLDEGLGEDIEEFPLEDPSGGAERGVGGEAGAPFDHMDSLGFSTMSSLNFDEHMSFDMGDSAKGAQSLSASAKDAPSSGNGGNESSTTMEYPPNYQSAYVQDASNPFASQQLMQQQYHIQFMQMQQNMGMGMGNGFEAGGFGFNYSPNMVGMNMNNLLPLSMDYQTQQVQMQGYTVPQIPGIGYPISTASSNNTGSSSRASGSDTSNSFNFRNAPGLNGGLAGSHASADTDASKEGFSPGAGASAGANAGAAVVGAGVGGKDESSRAAKSLATISRRFVEHFGEPNTIEYISGQLGVEDRPDAPATTNRVDGAAEVLGVHVRRIYELIKILEILSLVTFTGDKRGKFSWKGTSDFLMTLGGIQADGVLKFPEIAVTNGLRLGPTSPFSRSQVDGGSPLTLSPSSTPGRTPASPEYSSVIKQDGIIRNSVPEGDMDMLDFPGGVLHDGSELDTFDGLGGLGLLGGDYEVDNDVGFSPGAFNTDAGPKYSKKRSIVKKSKAGVAVESAGAGAGAGGGEEQQFMVEGICKSFLQLFLLGMDSLSMNFAIQKLVPMGDCQSLNEYNKLNATKIRRVYDVANVLCSLNLISKNTVSKSKIKTDSSSVEDKKDVLKRADAGGKAIKAESKSDSKVLEWSSFPHTTIREYYLQH